MTESEEILAVFRSLYRLVCEGRDADAAFALWAVDDDVALFGSEEGEADHGPAEVRAHLVAIASSNAAIEFAWRDERVHVEDDAAWVSAAGTLTVDGRSSLYRVTGVFVRRDGRWLWHTHSGCEPHPA